jgi:tripartite-type tricarboxylate transporter receptor subunit TctC
MMRIHCMVKTLVLLLAVAPALALAQDYPGKPVRMVVGFPPGSKLEGIGADGTVSRSPEEFAALVRADTARYARIVKSIGLKID